MRARLWRNRLEEYERLNPPRPSRWYSIKDRASELSLESLLDIDGVIGFGFMSGESQFSVSYEPGLITLAELDEKVHAAVRSASPRAPDTDRPGEFKEPDH